MRQNARLDPGMQTVGKYTWVAIACILIMVYLLSYALRFDFSMRFPDFWAKNEALIDRIFGPAGAVDEAINQSQRRALWMRLIGRWKVEYPQGELGEIEFVPSDSGGVSVRANEGFAFLNEMPQDLQLQIEGATVMTDMYFLSFLPRDGEIIVEVFEIPLNSDRAPRGYVFTKVNN